MKKFLLSIQLFKINSYISSLFLASLGFYFKIKEENWIIAFVQFFIVSLASLYIIWYFNEINKRKNNNIEEIQILSRVQEKFDTSNYLFSNILPIATLNYDEFDSIVIFCFTVVILGIIYYKNDLFYINPIYDILGKYTYTAKILVGKSTKPKETMLIAPFCVYDFENQYFYAAEKNNIVLVTSEMD